MSAPQWKPGDVAMVSAMNKREPYRAYFDGKTWQEYDAPGFCVDAPYTYRPLVVIDPEDREQVERVRQAIGGKRGCLAINRTEEMQAALRSLVTPPKQQDSSGNGGPADWVGLRAGRVLSEGWSE